MKIKTKPKSKRGFAAMDPELQRKIATMGGKTVSKDTRHMAEIGTMGGLCCQHNIRVAKGIEE